MFTFVIRISKTSSSLPAARPKASWQHSLGLLGPILLAVVFACVGTARHLHAEARPSGLTADLIHQVDPFIATQADHGQLFPGATVPFGLVKLSPDTTGKGHSGYQYQADRIIGFSHTRLGGVGCSGAGGTLKLKPSIGKSLQCIYSKPSEKASPGFYSVRFANQLQADLTVSQRVGFHRYTYPHSPDDAWVHVDSTHNYSSHVDSELRMADNYTLVGFASGKNVCGRQPGRAKNYHKLYFALRFDQPIDFSEDHSSGKCWLNFGPIGEGRVIQAKVAISPIDVPTAIKELAADAPGWSFEQTRKHAEKSWDRELSRVQIVDDRPEMEEPLRLFATCLYRSLLVPHNVTSSEKTYRIGNDPKTVRIADSGYTHYSGWSTWDDYRKFGLISLLDPDRSQDICQSIAEWMVGGVTPDMADGYWPSPSVRNEFMAAILLDAYSKGIRGFQLQDVYESGVPVHGSNELEKSYGYYIKMRIAEALGRDDEAVALREKALGYRDYWNPLQFDSQGTIRGFFTKTGSLAPQAEVDRIDAQFYEGNLWHYRYFVPHDMQGLVNLRGSAAAMAEDLSYYFENNFHTALNEPPLAYPFLFVYFGKPHLTQKWSRIYTTEPVSHIYHNHGKFPRVVKRPVYQAAPKGWLPTMDDDTGAMSSQYIFQALGLYPACYGDPYYILGSPVFREVRLNLPDGKQFSIVARGVSTENFYVQSATLNDKPYDKAWITHSEVVEGGRLVLQMGPTPNPAWGSQPEHRPPSLSATWSGNSAEYGARGKRVSSRSTQQTHASEVVGGR